MRPLGGLGATYDDHLKLIGKRAVDFLLVLIKLVSLRVTAEVLRAKIYRKLVFCKGVGQYPANFHVGGNIHHQSFLHK